MAYVVSAGPAEEPITLAEAKAQLRIDHDDEDTFISALITSAREQVEEDTWRALVTQTQVLHLDHFPCGRVIEITRPPLQDDVSVAYYGTDGTLQTFAAENYHVDVASQPGRVVLASGAVWPATLPDRPGAVQVSFVAGYGGAGNVPQRAKLAIKFLVGHWYNNREAVLVGTSSKEVEFAYAALINGLQWTALAKAG